MRGRSQSFHSGAFLECTRQERKRFWVDYFRFVFFDGDCFFPELGPFDCEGVFLSDAL
jgi:hypothetical protein